MTWGRRLSAVQLGARLERRLGLDAEVSVPDDPMACDGPGFVHSIVDWRLGPVLDATAPTCAMGQSPAGSQAVADRTSAPAGLRRRAETQIVVDASWLELPLPDAATIDRCLAGYAGQVSNQARPGHAGAASSIFFDIETGGFSSADSPVFMVGMARHVGRGACAQLRIEQWTLDRVAAEPAMLADVLRRLEAWQVDTVVSFNGRCFDLPFLRSRMARHRLDDSAVADKLHCDLLDEARKVWGRGGGSRVSNLRLQTLERELLGLTRACDLPSADVPEVFWTHMAERGRVSVADSQLASSRQALERVREHNELDLVTLPALARAIAEAHTAALCLEHPQATNSGRGSERRSGRASAPTPTADAAGMLPRQLGDREPRSSADFQVSPDRRGRGPAAAPRSNLGTSAAGDDTLGEAHGYVSSTALDFPRVREPSSAGLGNPGCLGPSRLARASPREGPSRGLCQGRKSYMLWKHDGLDRDSSASASRADMRARAAKGTTFQGPDARSEPPAAIAPSPRADAPVGDFRGRTTERATGLSDDDLAAASYRYRRLGKGRPAR